MEHLLAHTDSDVSLNSITVYITSSGEYRVLSVSAVVNNSGYGPGFQRVSKLVSGAENLIAMLGFTSMAIDIYRQMNLLSIARVCREKWEDD